MMKTENKSYMEAIKMRCKNIVCLTVILLTAGLVSANTVWNAVDANSIAAGYSNWNIASNWTNGVPGVAAPADTKAVFNVAAAVEARVTDSQTCQDLVMGDGGNAVVPEDNLLRIMDGGTLTTTGGWMAVGYNHPAKLIVEEGGVYHHNGHFWWGGWTGGEGVIEINGGTVSNGGDFSMGGHPQAGGTAHVYLNSGLLRIHHWGDPSTAIYDGSALDIKFGTFEITNDGDQTTQASNYIAAGKITGFGGLTTPVAVFANGVTTVTAPDPMNRFPAYTTVLAGDVDLTWTNLAPVAPATDVWVDVWFGTDPNKLSLAYSKVVAEGENTTSVTVGAPSITEPTTYYWQVDSYLYGDPAIVDYSDPNIPVIEGDVTPFEVTNDTPPSIVIETAPTVTWIGEPIQLDSTLTDDHPENVDYLWTAMSDGVSIDPNVVFSPSNTVADPTVTVDYHSGPFTVIVTVYDGFNPEASASVTHDCAESPCQAATAVLNLDDVYVGDIAVDCKIDLVDFAVMARQWLTDYTLTGPVPFPQE